MEHQSGDLFYVLQRIASDMHKHVDQMLLERLGVGVSQLRILHAVHIVGKVSQKALADSLGQTEASISRQIKLLVNKGLLETRTNTKNQREQLMSMTVKGFRITEAAHRDLDKSMQQFLQSIPDKQQKQFAEILNTLRIV